MVAMGLKNSSNLTVVEAELLLTVYPLPVKIPTSIDVRVRLLSKLSQTEVEALINVVKTYSYLAL